MKLSTETQSEKGKSVIKTANESIRTIFSVHREIIGEIELYLHNDTMDGKDKDYDEDEWILYHRNASNGVIDYEQDPTIIAQGNIAPKEAQKSSSLYCKHTESNIDRNGFCEECGKKVKN